MARSIRAAGLWWPSIAAPEPVASRRRSAPPISTSGDERWLDSTSIPGCPCRSRARRRPAASSASTRPASPRARPASTCPASSTASRPATSTAAPGRSWPRTRWAGRAPASARSRACARAPACAARSTGRSRSARSSAWRWTRTATPAGRSSSPGPATGKRVAIVGAGPAGLACAAELRRAGIDVTLFEARAQAGGLCAYGIVPWRHAREMTAHEVAEVERAGRRDPARRRASGGADGRRAASPASTPSSWAWAWGGAGGWGSPARASTASSTRSQLLEPVVTGEPAGSPSGRRVGVIGGGSTALDAAAAAVQLGADEVTVFYRRGEAEAPAYPHAIELARSLGVRFHWLAAPVEITGRRRPRQRRDLRPDAPRRARSERPARAPPGARRALQRRARLGRRRHRAGVASSASSTTSRSARAAAASPSTRRPAGPTTRASGPAATSSTAAARSSTRSRRRKLAARSIAAALGVAVDPGASRHLRRPGPRPGARRQPGRRAGRHPQPQPVLAGQRAAHEHRRDGRPGLRGRLGRRRLEDRRRADHERELAPGLARRRRPADGRHLEHRADQRPPDRDEPGRGPRGQAPLPGSGRRRLADGRVEARGLARHRQPGQRHRRRRHRAQLRLPARHGRAGHGVGRRPGPRVHRDDHRLGEGGVGGPGPRQAHPEHHRHHGRRAGRAAGRRGRHRAHQHDQLARRPGPRHLGDAPVRPRPRLARRLLGAGRQADRAEHGQRDRQGRAGHDPDLGHRRHRDMARRGRVPARRRDQRAGLHGGDAPRLPDRRRT